LKRRWKPAVAVMATTIAAITALAASQKPTYTASGKLLLRPNRLTALTNQPSRALRTESETLLSRPMLDRTIQALKLRDDQGKTVQVAHLAAAIQVTEVAGADVLKVTYSDRQRDRAAKVINQLLQEYIKSNLATQRAEARTTREFIDQALPQAETNLRQLDAAIRQFQESRMIADINGDRERLATAVSTIEHQITQANTELTETNARYLALRQQLQMDPPQALMASALSQSASVQQVIAQLQQLESQVKLESTRLQDGHPRIADLQQKVQVLRQIVNQRIVETVGNGQNPRQNTAFGAMQLTLVQDYLGADIARNSLAQRVKSLTQAYQSYRQRLGQFPEFEQQQHNLQRRLEVAQANYASLSQQQQAAQLAEQQIGGTVSLVESAIPAPPASGDGLMFLGMGLLLGSGLASATVLGLELADRSIKSVKEARELFGYSCLGLIPYWGNPRQAKQQMGLVPQLPVRDMPRSLVSAAYRMVQANLRFVNVDSSLRSVVVTSAVPREGKSTVAANLAATMAQLGRRVLLIDGDLHHPTQHHIWGLENGAGLSDVIIGQIALRQAIQAAMPNLHILTAGGMPPSPLTILDSHRMNKLIKGLETVYDMVIIDSPPLIVEAEALTLGRLAQGTLLVARPGILPTAAAKAAKELLQHSGQSVFGMVINSALLEPEAYRHADYNRDYYSREAGVTAIA
jgi:polysaccharide biosynthesis transport protein